MKILPRILQIGTFLLIAFLIGILALSIIGNKSNAPKKSPLIGKKFPSHEIAMFDGSTLNIDSLKGKVLLVNFWASWCGPCKQEFPALENSWKKYKDTDVAFLGINILDEEKQAKYYMQIYASAYPNGIDKTGAIAVDLGVSGVPETFFINEQGIIVEKYVGPLTEEIIDFYIKKTKSANG